MPGSSNQLEDLGKMAGSYPGRIKHSSFDVLRPWKVISPGNVYIIPLSVLLFLLYAFARHGLSWIALSTSLIASVPVGFAVAFFETQSQEFRRRHRRTPASRKSCQAATKSFITPSKTAGPKPLSPEVSNS